MYTTAVHFISIFSEIITNALDLGPEVLTVLFMNNRNFNPKQLGSCWVVEVGRVASLIFNAPFFMR